MPKRTRDWGALIREQLSSGKSQAEYCREHGLSVASFQYHKSKGVHVTGEKGCFVPIVSGADDSRVEVRFGEEVRLLFPLSTSPERLSEVVKCLSSK